MTHFLKAAVVWLAIGAVVWLLTIWRWQTTGHEASNGDIVLHLLALPTLLSAALLLVLWGVKALREQAAKPVVVATSANLVASTEEVPAHAASTVVPHAWVIGEAALLPVGSDVGSAWSTLQGTPPRPGLDADLQDLDGMPVFTARVPDMHLPVGLAGGGELSPPWWPGAGNAPPSQGVQRALLLLQPVLQDALGLIATLVPADSGSSIHARVSGQEPAPECMRAHLSGVAAPVSAADVAAAKARAPQLTVRLCLPCSWPALERQAAVDWVRGQSGSLLDWVETTGARGVRWVIEPLEQPEAVWDEVDRTLVQWSRQAQPELMLLLAVDSGIDEAHVERQQATGRLFTAAHQSGQVPGEGAAALLLASPHWPGLNELDNTPIKLWQPVRTRRDKSADALGRLGSTALGAALKPAFDWTQPETAHLRVVSDADHRASRSAELFEALQDVAPGLDPMTQVTRVGEFCGDLGQARSVATAALACQALRQSDDPQHTVALLTQVQASHERVVVALTPRASEPLLP